MLVKTYDSLERRVVARYFPPGWKSRLCGRQDARRYSFQSDTEKPVSAKTFVAHTAHITIDPSRENQFIMRAVSR